MALKAENFPFKYTLAVSHHSTLVVTIREASTDLLADCIGSNKSSVEEGNAQINVYHLPTQFSGDSLVLMEKLLSTIKEAGDWYDKSDSQTDYFNTAFYIDINIGSQDKPCVFVKPKADLAKSLNILINHAGSSLRAEDAAPSRIDAMVAEMGQTSVGQMLSRDALYELAFAAAEAN
jgi:hypothetical protein